MLCAAIRKTRVVWFLFVFLGVPRRPTTVTLVFANNLKKCDRNETPRSWDQRVARLVPVGVVFSAYDMEKIALAEGQLLRIPRFGPVVIKGFDNLRCWNNHQVFGFMLVGLLISRPPIMVLFFGLGWNAGRQQIKDKEGKEIFLGK